eukprot:360484-Chlamydomonas_euryale.AAC.2
MLAATRSGGRSGSVHARLQGTPISSDQTPPSISKCHLGGAPTWWQWRAAVCRPPPLLDF